MYRVTYGKDLLHDPVVGLVLETADLEMEVNTAGSFTFKVYHGHPMFGKMIERDTKNAVRIYDNEKIIFEGDILSIEDSFLLTQEITCRGCLGWLNDSIVRPYSTLESECENVAPNTVDGYFAWLIENHNKQVEEHKRFTVGVNEGSFLDPNNYIYRSDSSYPNTGQVIKEKIIESVGGYVRVRYEKGMRYIDLLSDFPKVNAQVIDFGVNLLDYSKSDITDDLATFIVPIGKEIEGEEAQGSEIKRRTTIASLEDGNIETDYVKSGDLIYSPSAVMKRGWIGAVVEFSDVTEPDNLLSKGLLALKGLVSPVRTVEITAVDLAKINPKYEPILSEQYVRARSKPHNFDSFMLCSKIQLDLVQPDNDKFTLGTTFDVFSGQQNARIKQLNANINNVYEAADAISAEAKAAAIVASQAKTDADELKDVVIGKPSFVLNEAAIGYAVLGDTDSNALTTRVNQAQASADNASIQAEAAAISAGEATTAANDAKTAADKAAQAAVDAEAKAQAAQQDAAQAVSKATEAEEAVKSATDAANAAQAAAQTAQAAAGSATDKATAAQTAASEAKTAAADASTVAEAAKLDAEQAKKDIAALDEELETVSNTMTADYARKTDLTEASASLQSQISQNAGQIASTVSRLETVDETANDAKDQAAAAQTKANEAATAAAGAQSTADTAKANAATAQTKANEAAIAASNAQKAADDADAKAAQAAANLATAEQNLANVTSRVGATEEEIEAAQAAVETAQAAADKAKADAAAAQSTADTAKTNAANAKTAADNAKAAADAAQADANAAQAAADKAQGDVNALTTRVTNAETSIKQNSDAIALRATKTEVTQTLGGYYTKKETDSAINVAAGNITSTVEELQAEMETNYATKSEVTQTASGLSVSIQTAQNTADTAKSNAATAQNTANTANTAAGNAASAANTAQSTANTAKDNAATAQNTANTARTEAANAAKTATNFMSYDASGGLQVGNKTSGSWSGFRTQITSTAFNVLNAAGEVLASYGANLIELGRNSINAVIKLCGGKGEISYNGDEDYLEIKGDSLRINAKNWASLYSYWINTPRTQGSKTTVNVASNQINMYSQGSSNLVDGVGTWNTTSLTVDPYQINGLSDRIVLSARYGMSLDTVSEDINITSGGSINVHSLVKSDKTHNAFLVEHGEEADAYYTASRTDTGTTVRFGIGSGGVNHGVYSTTQGRWLIRGNANNEIYIGSGRGYGAHDLYNNATGTTGTVTLSETAANFECLEVFAYCGSAKRSTSVKVYSPNGKTAVLFIPWGSATSNWEYRGAWAISGTSMTCSVNHTFNPSTSATASVATNEMSVYRVIGYK